MIEKLADKSFAALIFQYIFVCIFQKVAKR